MVLVYRLFIVLLLTSCNFDFNPLGNQEEVDGDHSPPLETIFHAVVVTAPIESEPTKSPYTTTGECRAGYTVTFLNSALVTNPTIFTCPSSGLFSESLVFNNGNDGAQTLSYYQIDFDGEAGPTTNVNIILDMIAPNTPNLTSLSPTPNSSIDGNNPFSLNGDCDPGDTVIIDNLAVNPNPTTTICDASGNFAVDVAFNPGNDGLQTVTISYQDPAGNISQGSSVNYIVDSTPPGALIVAAPSENTLVPGNPNTFDLTVVCSPGDNVKLQNTNLTGSPISNTCSASGTYTFLGLTFNGGTSAGNQELVLTATDGAGNVSAPTAHSLTLDNVSPLSATISNPIASSVVSNPVSVNGTCESGTTVTLSSVGMSPATIDVICSANGEYSSTVSISDGVQTITVSQEDQAGNVSPSSSVAVTMDSAAPGAIDLPDDNGSTVPSPHTSVATSGGNCEAGAIVYFVSDALETNPTIVTCDGSGDYSAALSFIAGSDGLKNIEMYQIDSAGNQSVSLNASYLIDATAPSLLSLTLPTANSTYANDVDFSGTCEPGTSINISGANVNTVTPPTITCTVSGSFSALVNFNPDGLQNLDLTQVDSASNVSDVLSISILVDDTDPVPTTPNIPAVTSIINSYEETFSGTCEAETTIEFNQINLNPDTQITNCLANGSFSVLLSFDAGVNVLTQTFNIKTTDAVGNFTNSTYGTFDINTSPSAPPVVSAPTSGTAINENVDVNVTCKSATDVIEITNSNIVPNPTSHSCVGAGAVDIPIVFNPTDGSADGSQTLQVTSTESGTTSAPTNVLLVLDTIHPVVPEVISPSENSFVKNTTSLVVSCVSGDSVIASNANLASSITSVCNSFGQATLVLTWNVVADGNTETLNIISRDGVQNDSNLLAYDLVVDLTEPDAPVIESPEGGLTVGPITDFNGTCEAGTTVLISTVTPGIMTPNPIETTCGSDESFTTYANFSAGLNSSVTFTATQTDPAGNLSLADTVTVTVDTVGPGAPVVSAPTSGASVDGSFDVVATCDVGGILSVAHTNILPSPTEALCDSSPKTISINVLDLSGTSDGQMNLEVTSYDSSGNSSATTLHIVNLDTTAPDAPTMPISPSIGSVVSDPTDPVTGLCNTGDTIRFEHPGLNTSPVNVVCAGGTYSANLDWAPAASDGSKTITIKAIDNLLNESDSINYQLVLDTTAPIVVAPTTPDDDSRVPGYPNSFSFAGTCTDNDVLTITNSNMSPSSVSTTCSMGTYSVPLSFNNGIAGAEVISLTMTDPAGNTSSVLDTDVVVDTTAPGPIIGLTIADTMIQSTSAPQVNWLNPTDVDLGKIEIAYGTGIVGSQINNLLDWTDISLATAHNNISIVNPADFSVNECTIVNVSIRAVDQVGNISSATSHSTGFYWDDTAPVLGVPDVSANDATSISSPLTTWVAAIDNCSATAIDKYEISVGSSVGASDITEGYLDLGDVNSYRVERGVDNAPDLMSFEYLVENYTSLKVTDKAGNISPIRTSSPWIWNFNPPVDVPGIILWVSAEEAKESVLDSSGRNPLSGSFNGFVDEWKDISESTIDHHFTDTSSSLRPSYGVDPNGISYIADGCLTTPNDDEINTATVNQRNINVAFETGNNITTRQVLYEEGGGTRGMNVYVYNSRVYCGFWNTSDDGDGIQNFTSASFPVEESEKYIVSWIFDYSNYTGPSGPDGSLKCYVNGTQVGGDLTTTSRLFAHSAAVGLGCQYSASRYESGSTGGSNSNLFDGKIYELMMFQSAPDTSTVSDVYLNFKSRLNF